MNLFRKLYDYQFFTTMNTKNILFTIIAIILIQVASARQAVTTAKTVSYSLLLRFNYFGNYSSIAAWATFIYDYSPIGYIAGVCEVYALWYDFFLKLLLS